MRCVNKVLVSGRVSGKIAFKKTNNGSSACSFPMTSVRQGMGGSVLARTKINCYGEGLVDVCKARLEEGLYVLIEGELMNREGQFGELTEVRAKEIVFFPRCDVVSSDDDDLQEGADNGRRREF